MRCFIGFSIDQKAKNQVLSLYNKLKNEKVSGNYTLTNNLHITLLFLGEVSLSKEKEIIEVLKKIPKDNFYITLNNLSLLKDILTINVEKCEKLQNLYDYLLREIKQLDIIIDERPYKPHLTLIRKVINPYFIQFNTTSLVNSIVLYESTYINNTLCYLERFKIKL